VVGQRECLRVCIGKKEMVPLTVAVSVATGYARGSWSTRER
jgi:hypothetical protein